MAGAATCSYSLLQKSSVLPQNKLLSKDKFSNLLRHILKVIEFGGMLIMLAPINLAGYF
jgi:hypothetical protein